MFSPAAISVAKDVFYDFRVKPLSKHSSFSGYSVIGLNKRYTPSPEAFKNLDEAIFVTSFPFAQKAIETVVLATILKPNKVTIAVKDISSSNDAKIALFTANQLEIPIIFLPTGSGNFTEIMKDITREWIFDSRVKVDCYPIKLYFRSHVNSALSIQGEDQSFVSKYCNHVYKQHSGIRREIMQAIDSMLPKEAIRDVISRLK